MNVPLLDLNAHHQPLRKKLPPAVEAGEKIAACCQTRFGLGVLLRSRRSVDCPESAEHPIRDEVIAIRRSFYAMLCFSAYQRIRRMP
jgi:hypothetical protein